MTQRGQAALPHLDLADVAGDATIVADPQVCVEVGGIVEARRLSAALKGPQRIDPARDHDAGSELQEVTAFHGCSSPRRATLLIAATIRV